MTKPIIKFHNAETDEIIEREMTDAEFEEYKITADNYAKRKAEYEAKEAERQAILDRIGLTTEELQTILG